jgi:transcriptional regulator with XRE-family HTH domain
VGESVSARTLVRLGQEIRRRRLDLGWTLEQFAEACSVTPNYLGTIEAGRRDVHLTTLVAIARALECTIGDLVAEPETDISEGARELAALYQQAPSEAKEAVHRMLRVLVKDQGKDTDKDKDPGKGTQKSKSSRRGREGGPPS